jgi:hypothetical protein
MQLKAIQTWYTSGAYIDDDSNNRTVRPLVRPIPMLEMFDIMSRYHTYIASFDDTKCT